ncbi:UNVERIFIED_CONTAM: Srs domain protein [Hammondia hammondi]|eukprot:XP_008882589.1 Srs domain protein [Hammondia hammondi]
MERKAFFAGPARPALEVLFLLSVTHLFLSAMAAGRQQNLTAIEPTCSDSDNGTTCTCPENAAQGVKTGVTPNAFITESKTTVSVQCPANYEFVPGEKAKVCSVGEDANNLVECKNNPGGEINKLLYPAPEKLPEWSTSGDGQTTNSLTLPRANLPLSDKKFFVGCLSKAEGEVSRGSNKKSCVVTVQVAAKKSILTENVMTCAYGTESNTNSETPVATLTSDNNTLTVECGTEGQLQPSATASFTAFLCEKDKCTTSVKLSDVFPNFDEKWLTVDATKGTNTLRIPKEGFPEEDKMIMVGCSLKTETPGTGRNSATSTATQPTCKVKVAISASTTSAASHRISSWSAFALGSASLLLSGAYLTSF